MSLPRIFLQVSDGSGGRWEVRVKAAEDGHEFTPYHMDSIEVDVGDRDVRVPVVPPCRQPDKAEEHWALSTGDTATLGAMLGRLASGHTRGNDVRVYGRWLFECLLAPVWREICEHPAVRAARGMELALQWVDSQADLHSLVWEAMHDGTNALAGLPDTLIVVTRVVQVDYPEPATIDRVPRVLFATGSSLTEDVIRPGAMFMGLLRKFDGDGICVTRAVHDVSLTDLQVECQAFQPDVVHLVAHGEIQPDGSSVLLLGSRSGGTGVGARQLRHALTAGGVPLSVVLSACHSGGGPVTPDQADGPGVDGPEADEAGEPVTWRAAPMAAELVAGGIPIVTAMAGAVSEPACRMYTTRLVDAIHRGEPLGRAAAEGRAAALTGAAAPSQQLDWAMPTIFLASSVQPDFRPLNPASVNRLIGIADSLKLRRNPVFIGRHQILTTIDNLFSSDSNRRTGFLTISRDGALDKLGSTRLLQEIGFRLLRTGHVPLLLANYSEVDFGDVTAGVPRSLRKVLADILQQAVRIADEFGLRPPRLRALGGDPYFASDGAVTGVDMADLNPWDARQRARRTLREFATRTEALDDPASVKSPLIEDLAELAGIMEGAGEPFGSHTRVVVLADRVHQWTGALGPLLQMIGSHGLGVPGRPAPVVVTSSLSGGEGPKLMSFLDENIGSPGLKHLELTTLNVEEAALGFQWVLLNPWHPQARYRRVYVAARNTSQSVARQILSVFDGEPASVRLELYRVIQSHTATGEFVEHDDEAMFDLYTRLHQ